MVWYRISPWHADAAIGQAGVLVAVDAGADLIARRWSAVAGSPSAAHWLARARHRYYNGAYMCSTRSATASGAMPPGSHSTSPNDYFDAVPNLTDTIDFTVANDILLHADGTDALRLQPIYEPPGGGPTGANVCGSVLYNDTRAGRAAGPRIVDAQLVGVTYNEPPEPSLFFLDGFGRGAYRFSLALNFLERFRVTTTEQGEATALALGIDKTLYLAVGDQIFAARTAAP
jgi:hypothetical protein